MNLSPEYVLLGLLYNQPMHGYELHQIIQREFSQVWYISQSQAYNILNRLVSQGMLDAERLPGEGTPERHLLHLTEKGKTHFETWLKTPTHAGTQTIRTEFITRLAFAKQKFPELLPTILSDQEKLVRDQLIKLKDQYRTMQDDSFANQIALELRIRSLSDIAEWLSDLATRYT
jgi:DNA-binding PadR family transcriptional regulator